MSLLTQTLSCSRKIAHAFACLTLACARGGACAAPSRSESIIPSLLIQIPSHP